MWTKLVNVILGCFMCATNSGTNYSLFQLLYRFLRSCLQHQPILHCVMVMTRNGRGGFKSCFVVVSISSKFGELSTCCTLLSAFNGSTFLMPVLFSIQTRQQQQLSQEGRKKKMMLSTMCMLTFTLMKITRSCVMIELSISLVSLILLWWILMYCVL